MFQTGIEAVVPQLILGGEWTSTIKLTNRSAKSIPATNVYFEDNLGQPLKASFQSSGGSLITDVGFNFSLGPGAIVEATFYGGAASQFGHAIVDLCPAASGCIPGLYGEVALRNRNPTRPDFESIFPFEQPTALQYLLWDHRDGITTTLYLVNDNLTATTVSLEFFDVTNRSIRTVEVRLQSLESQILTLHSLVPETIGRQGTLIIRGQNSAGALITATALRINPTNSFTPVRTFVPKL